ncbi:MAG: response regulator transcription factor [Anaerolineae bacterium]|nr:response regulator transcription factor [Anaerolineae bacterium]
MPVHTVLLVEGRKSPQKSLLRLINDKPEYQVVTASTRRDALARVQEIRPAVIVLDSPSLSFSARRFCAALKENGLETPVLLLLPASDKIDRTVGAQAYMRYPVSARKLTNRILRLLPTQDQDVLQIGEVVLNIKQRCVIRGDRETHLTPRQATLLELFMRHPGEILTRAYLMKQVWNTDYIGDTRTLDVHIHWLRKAIEDDHKSPVYLRTVRRVGYRFEAPEAPACKREQPSSRPEEANP